MNKQNKKQYPVAKLASMAGVSVRTLHVYDRIGLLQPASRSPAGYRCYTEPELLRLQQILFYKELGLSLEAIASILDDPDFDLEQALASHRNTLEEQQARISTMIATIDKTIIHLKQKDNNTMQHEELYEGLSREEATAYRNEAIRQYGLHAVEQSEKSLKERSKASLEALKAEQKEIMARLEALQQEAPGSDRVQEAIALHYANIRRFWGTSDDPDPQAAAYRGLADLYINDERFLQTDGRARPALAAFLKAAILYFAEHSLCQ